MSLFHLPTIRLPTMRGYKFQKGRGEKFFLARRWEPMNADRKENSQDAGDISCSGALVTDYGLCERAQVHFRQVHLRAVSRGGRNSLGGTAASSGAGSRDPIEVARPLKVSAVIESSHYERTR